MREFYAEVREREKIRGERDKQGYKLIKNQFFN